MGVVIPWTDEEDTILLSGYHDGLTDATIATLLDRTETACRKRRQRRGARGPGGDASVWKAHGRWWVGERGPGGRPLVSVGMGTTEAEALKFALEVA